MIFEQMENHDYEQLVFCHDKDSGLKAIICIHDTTLGPALGGMKSRIISALTNQKLHCCLLLKKLILSYNQQ